jgi:hypothetical protein
MVYKLHKNLVHIEKQYVTIQSMVAQRSIESVDRIAFRLS